MQFCIELTIVILKDIGNIIFFVSTRITDHFNLISLVPSMAIEDKTDAWQVLSIDV
jgi:hypothetical protein